MEYPVIFQNLIDCFRKIPGIGAKTAERMAYDVLAMKPEEIEKMATSILSVNQISRCPICGNLTENNELCEICASEERDHSVVCVVHSPKDVFAFEKMKEYRGTYHVLNGYISSNSKNNSFEDVDIPSLISRIESSEIKEVILATDSTRDGTLTTMYIAKLLNEYPNLVVTRLAQGLPNGAQLDYTDELTLFRAFSNRKNVNENK